MSKVHDNKGYCSECGNWSIECKTITVYANLEKVCLNCRNKYKYDD